MLNANIGMRRLQEKVTARRRRNGVETIDYVAEPRQSGYRAVHLICMYSGKGVSRPVEVQLRTPAMHSWAVMVEEVSARLGVNHKQDGHTRVPRVGSSVVTPTGGGRTRPPVERVG